MKFDIHILIPIAIIVIALALLGVFIQKYYRPARKIKKQILSSIDNLNIVNAPQNFHEDIFSNDELKEAYRAYKKTLHEIKKVNDSGINEVISVKASAPAEMYFTHTNIIDTPLQMEFFKHLPGIVTGIGIVGTFVGLILGLQGFNASGSPQQVQLSVNNLMDGVLWAFAASGSAIGISLIITYCEKLQLKNLYANLEKLHVKIDSIFEQELVENYLSDIVSISEQNLTQSRHLKDAFVDDLKKLLLQVSNNSIKSQDQMFNRLQSSYQETSNNIAHVMSHSIKDALQEPLNLIANSVSQATQNQGEAVNTLLTDVLTQFMHQLESYFGKQMMDVSGVLQQTTTSLNEMQLGITSLIGEMRNAGLEHSVEVNAQMSKMMESMQISQKMAQDKLVDVLNQISTKGNETNQALQQQVQSILENITTQIATQMAQMTSMLEKNRAFSQKETEENTKKFYEQTQLAMTTVVKQLSNVTSAVGEKLQNGQLETVRTTQAIVQGATKSFEQNMIAIEDQRVKSEQERTAIIEEAQNTSKQLNEKLMESISATLAEFSKNINETISSLHVSQQQTQSANQSSIELLKQSTMDLLSSIDQSISANKENINKLSAITTSAISGLNSGAEKIGLAVSKMEGSATVTSAILDRSGGLIAQSSEVAQALTNASKQLAKMLTDYESANSTVQTAVKSFSDVFNSSQFQIQSTGQILKDMQDLSNRFSEVQIRTQEYIENISIVLSNAFKEFRVQTKDSLQNTLSEFDAELARGVTHLASSIEDLASTAEDIAELQQKARVNNY